MYGGVGWCTVEWDGVRWSEMVYGGVDGVRWSEMVYGGVRDGVRWSERWCTVECEMVYGGV